MRMMLHEIGDLRHRLALQQPGETADDIGGVTRSFATIATVFGMLELASASEGLQDERKGQLRKATATIRYRADVAADWRLLFETRIFQVTGSFDPDGRRRWLVLQLEEFTP